MLNTKLILIEGLPGSGKSTTAQFISHCLTKSGIDNRWWYEEEKGHPVYVFDSDESMAETIDDLSQGRYEKVIEKALLSWEHFSKELQSSDTIILVDSCYFGYLTWSLFPMDVSNEIISKYILEVERIISPCNPCLIYFNQNDIYTSLKQICEKRGGNTAERFITNATDSVYGNRRKLSGFNGMVRFWEDYRAFTDQLFTNIDFPKISIANLAGEWQLYLKRILHFLEVPLIINSTITKNEMEGYVGKYSDYEFTCEVYQKDNDLFINGLPIIWPSSRLLPRDYNLFEVESLPIYLRFLPERLHITGPELFDGVTEKIMIKKDSNERMNNYGSQADGHRVPF
jgi:hypothetical protein